MNKESTSDNEVIINYLYDRLGMLLHNTPHSSEIYNLIGYICEERERRNNKLNEDKND